jgi:hypothetical protein
VSVKVDANGRRIETQNIGRSQSERARKEIENEFCLVKASSKKQQQSEHLKPVLVSANYGKVETKRAISNIRSGAVDKYKFTSIPELNAVLNRYNVAADRENEESRTFKKGGLHYRLLNAKGERVGVPIKARDFHQKPTLNYLQNRFEINDQLRQTDKLRIKNAIGFTLYGKRNVTLDRFGQSATSKSYLLATPEQSNGARLANGEDSLFGPIKKDGFTPADLRGSKRRKKKEFSQSL